MFLATCLALRHCVLTPWLLFGCLTPQLPEPLHVLIPFISVNKRLMGCWALRAPLLFLQGTDTVPLLGVCSLQGASFPGAQIKNTVHFG